MNTETVNDFAAFEAAANAGEVIEEKAEPAKEEAKAEEPLDLTADDEAVEVEEGDDGGEEHTDAEGKRRRSKPASQRIAELTKRLRETEKELEAERAPKNPTRQEVKSPEKPDPANFEFGESDPDYIRESIKFEMAAERAEQQKADQANEARQGMLDRIGSGVAKAEETAKAKYEDFDAKIAEAVEARGGDPLPPMLTIGVSVSPVGGDILYRLATDEAASARLEKLAKGGAESANAMALAFGELEAEYLDDDSDADLDMTDQLDMARMMGRMRARLKGAKATTPASKISVTNAPEPPANRARGGSGQFQVDGSTTDFAKFEKLANGRR